MITNKHVISTGEDYTFDLCLTDSAGGPIDQKVITCRGKTSEWYLHPAGLDLACLPIAPFLHNIEKTGNRAYYRAFDVSLIPSEEKLNELASVEDIYIIGYPTGLEDTFNHKPLVRKGITATHPKRDYLGRKEFVVDCPVFPGSSGSPVILFNQGSYSTSSGITIGQRLMLLGIAYATYTAELIPVTIETAQTTIAKIPNDLGLVIKSSELLVFEKILETQ